MGRTDGEDVGAGDENRSSGDVPGEPAGLVSLPAEMAASFVSEDASANGGEAPFKASDQVFREALEALAGIVPEGVSVEVWSDWLSNGPPLFKTGEVLRRPVVTTLTNAAVLKDHDQRSRAASRDIEKARRALAEAEQRKRYHDAVRKATLQYTLVERLVSVMKPVFAMGPAWSVMRAVAFWRKVPQPIVDAHGGDAFLSYELFQHSLSEIEETSGETILRGLHVMMGDPVFEARLHMALYDCVAEFSAEIESRERGMVLDYAAVRRRPGDDEAAVGRLGALSGLLRKWRRAGKKRQGPWTHGPDDLGNSAALLDKNEAG